MRTTLDIADDVLLAAQAAAQQQNVSVGAVISDLARLSLLRHPAPMPSPSTSSSPFGSRLVLLGIEPLPQRGGIVTNELINQLRGNGID